MQALVFDSELSVGDIDEPIPEPSEAVVSIRSAGICGTDLAITRGYADFDGVLGHEFVGVVEEAEMAPQWIGRRVVAEINVSCGNCRRCRQGAPNHCSRRSVVGIRGRAGAFAERVCVPVSNLHEVPASVTDDAAVFVEPLAAAFRIAEQVELDAGTEVAIWGDGRLGLCSAMALATTGCRLTVVGRHPRKLEIAKALGATVRLSDDVIRPDFDVVVEATGSASGLRSALRHVRPLGAIVLKSTLASAPTFDTSRIVVDEIRLLGSRCGPFDQALDALERGAVDPTPLIDARYALHEGLAAFEHANRAGVLKVLVDP